MPSSPLTILVDNGQRDGYLNINSGYFPDETNVLCNSTSSSMADGNFAFFYFDCRDSATGLAGSDTITDVKLRLYVNYAADIGGLGAWGLDICTSGAWGTVMTSAAMSGGETTSFEATGALPSAGWMEIPITPSHITRNTNYTAFRFTPYADTFAFYIDFVASEESILTAYRPQLVLTYTSASGASAPQRTLLGVGI